MLHSLYLRDFRCFTEARVELDPQFTFFIGRNAQGKTSLLEALCVLFRLQSPRTSSRMELIRLGAGSFCLEGHSPEVRLRCAQSSKVRRLALDGAVCPKIGDYLMHAERVVWMDHRDMSLLRGGAEFRRRYLDFAASQIFPEYLQALRSYERALRGRNYVLKRDAVIAWRQADAYAQVMHPHALTLRRCRASLLEMLRPIVAELHQQISQGSEALEVNYVPSWEGEDLAADLLAMREEESRTRQTGRGPHRDDFVMKLNGLEAASYASEGQHRSAALALKVAQARAFSAQFGRPPVLLIDDVFGELDAHRRRALLALLPEDAQKIITTTHLDWATGAWPGSLRIYEIEAAALSLRSV